MGGYLHGALEAVSCFLALEQTAIVLRIGRSPIYGCPFTSRDSTVSSPEHYISKAFLWVLSQHVLGCKGTINAVHGPLGWKCQVHRTFQLLQRTVNTVVKNSSNEMTGSKRLLLLQRRQAKNVCITKGLEPRRHDKFFEVSWVSQVGIIKSPAIRNRFAIVYLD